MTPEQEREYGPRPKLSQPMSPTKYSQSCSTAPDDAVEFNPQDFEATIEKGISDAGKTISRRMKSI